jgi:hypothetical protein
MLEPEDGPTRLEVQDIEVAHGRECVALFGHRPGRKWGEVLRPDEADTLAELLHQQADAARHTQ